MYLRLFSSLLLSLLLLACNGAEQTQEQRAASNAAAAADFPQHPLRVIIPFGPGGLADVTMRLAGEELAQRLGQPVIIENRPGAGGVAATSTMLNADADGYTLIVLTNGSTIAETQFPNLPYDITTDLQAVSALAWFDLVFLTSPDSGLKSLQDVLQKATNAPQGIRIATINPGSTQHLSAELFKKTTGIKATIITYRTTPDVLGALLRNEVDVVIDAYTALKGAIDGGQALPLAVTGSTRNAALPEVPTVLEAGVADYEVTGWNALYTQKAVPADIVTKLHEAVVAVVALPDIQQRFAELGVEARANTPEQMQERLLADIQRWRKVMIDAGLAP